MPECCEGPELQSSIFFTKQLHLLILCTFSRFGESGFGESVLNPAEWNRNERGPNLAHCPYIVADVGIRPLFYGVNWFTAAWYLVIFS